MVRNVSGDARIFVVVFIFITIVITNVECRVITTRTNKPLIIRDDVKIEPLFNSLKERIKRQVAAQGPPRGENVLNAANAYGLQGNAGSALGIPSTAYRALNVPPTRRPVTVPPSTTARATSARPQTTRPTVRPAVNPNDDELDAVFGQTENYGGGNAGWVPGGNGPDFGWPGRRGQGHGHGHRREY